MKHLQDLHVLILGLGASGLAMARWCARHGAHVTVADTRDTPPQLATLQRDVPAAQFVGGAFSAALVDGTTIRAVYRSPGLSPTEVALVCDAARAVGLPVGGELSLFAQALADLAQVDAAPVPEDAPAEDLGTAAATESQEAASTEPADAVAETAVAAEDSEEPAPVVPALPEPTGYHPAVLAISGTNGKTTVTSLTGQLVERAGKTVAVAGNIGPTLLDTLSAHMDADTLPQVWVLELSSFQLDGIAGFEPTAATVLNLSQDHLDWHGSMAAYAEAKSHIFGAHGLMLLNREDPAVMAMLPAPIKAKLQRPVVRSHLTFGGDMPQRAGDFGIELVNGMAWLVWALEADETRKRRKGEEEEIHIQRLMPADALRIRGRHNAVNALAALALASAAGCSLGPMLYGLRDYRGEPHRVESVAIVHGVEYFDDSKGTNVGATVAALQGLGADRSVVLILGGEGKGQDFSPLAAPVARFARAVVLIGRDAPLIRAALDAAGVPLFDASTMDDAVAQATVHAQAGDAVLMSPACASFDMFDNYEHRARVFCAAVETLAAESGVFVEGAA